MRSSLAISSTVSISSLIDAPSSQLAFSRCPHCTMCGLLGQQLDF
jgi:hypothetical protein